MRPADQKEMDEKGKVPNSVKKTSEEGREVCVRDLKKAPRMSVPQVPVRPLNVVSDTSNLNNIVKKKDHE